MIAVGLDFERQALTQWEVDRPPRPGVGEVVWRVAEVGVCGTDRELAMFTLGYPPPGERRLTIGHEAAGQVVQVGPEAGGLAPGDWVTAMIRRPCSPACSECGRGRRDLCLTGGFTERGIFGVHGYFTEFALDAAADLVRVPSRIIRHAVLVEPLSVVEKTIERALQVHPGSPRTALVLGAGPIGMLSAFALHVRGLDVTLLSLEPPESPRARLLETAGVRYVTSECPKAEVVIEAAGVAQAGFDAIAHLTPNGVCGILGARNGEGPVPFLDMIRGNHVVFGSVNAHRKAFEAAVEDLGRFEPAWLDGMLHRLSWRDYRTLLTPPPGAVKVVHTLGDDLH